MNSKFFNNISYDDVSADDDDGDYDDDDDGDAAHPARIRVRVESIPTRKQRDIFGLSCFMWWFQVETRS